MFSSLIQQARARLGQSDAESIPNPSGESTRKYTRVRRSNSEDGSISPATDIRTLQERRSRGHSFGGDVELAENGMLKDSASQGGPSVHAHTFLRGYNAPPVFETAVNSSPSTDSPPSSLNRLFTGIHMSASNAILTVGGLSETPGTGGGAAEGAQPKAKDSDFHLNRLVHDFNQKQYIPIVLGAPFWACFFYSLVSTSMVLVNKLILTTYQFRYPMVLLFHQNLMTVNSLYLAKEMGVTTYEPLESKKVIRWLPLDILFVLMLLTGFYSVELLSVPMITIFKNTNNIFIAIGDALVFGNFPSPGVVWTMLLMLLAAMLASVNDLEYNFEGYAWTFGNCLASTAFVLYAQTAIAKTSLSTFGKVYYNNILALPLVVLADYFVFHDFERLFLRSSNEELMKFFTFDFAMLWFISGILGFLQSLSSLKAQHLTSPTTYSMVGSLNKIPLTFLGVYIFNSPINAKGVLYVSMSILAGGLYSYTKAKEDIAARQQQQQQQSSAKSPQQQLAASLPPMAVVQSGDVHLRHKSNKLIPEERDGLLSGSGSGPAKQ